MKKIIFTILTLIAAILAFTYNGFSLMLGALLLFSTAFLLIIGLLRIVRRINRKWYQLPIMIMMICLIGITAGFLRPYEPAIIDSGNVSENLEHAYLTDQGDRMTLKVFLQPSNESLQARDSLRLAQVQRFYNEQKITNPLDKFHAAFIYHHAGGSEYYKIANKLATEAADAEELKGHYQAQWLVKASYDRWMVSLGKPQKYDTQGKFSLGMDIE